MKRPPWKLRRRIVNLTLLFCAGVVIWLIARGEDTALAGSIVNAAFLLAGMVIGSYVFGAAWDDRNVMKTMGTEAYDDTDQEPAP